MESALTKLASASDDKVVINLAGRITADNAPELKDALTALRSQHAAGTLVLDVDKLDYISSAGLRVLLGLAKSRDSKNLTPERAQGVIAQVLPQFRAMQPQIVAVVSNWQ